MTPDELAARQSIRHVLASYNMNGDRLKADDLAACFAEDGILESEFSPAATAFRHEGRTAIRAWFAGFDRQPEIAARKRAATFVRHNLTTSLIDVTGPTTAKARSYFAVFTDIGPDHAGIYIDEFRKTDGRWLIARRKVRLDWRAVDSLF
jgi:ketosteroid isomerase-like protein